MRIVADVVDALVGHPFAFLFIAGFFGYCVATIISHRRLRHVPGPPLASISQLWLAYATSKGDLYRTLQKVVDQYGSPARIAPDMVLFEDPDIYRAALAPRSLYKRGDWYKGMQLDPRIDNLLSERNEKRHTELRSKMLPAYTGKEVPDMEAMIDERVQDLISLIQRLGVEQRETVDFARIAQYFTLDSLTHIAFGRPLGFLHENRDLYDYNASSTAFMPVLAMGASVPIIGDILKSRIVQFLAGPKSKDKAGLGAIIGWSQEVVRQRFEGKSTELYGRPYMLDSFIKHGLTQLEAESESLLQILAGSDSTATAIRMSILFLLTNPPVYAKLRNEVDNATQSGTISKIVQVSEAASLPYLQAVIKETTRVWQPLTGIATKIAPPGGLTCNGISIPGGTQLAIHNTGMMTRKDIWGSDGDVFRPERWHEADPQTLKLYERTWELTFGGGQYTCPGKPIALMETSKVIFELMRRFDLGLVNPVKTMDNINHQLYIQRNMNLRANARST